MCHITTLLDDWKIIWNPYIGTLNTQLYLQEINKNLTDVKF